MLKTHLTKFNIFFVIKALETVGIDGKYLKIIKLYSINQHYIIANIVLNGDILSISSKIRNEIREDDHSSLF